MGGWGPSAVLRLIPIRMSLQRLQERDASTNFTDVDGCDLPAEAETGGQKEVSVCVDARAIVPVQSGVRGLREDLVTGAHSEARALAGRMFQSGG